MSLIQSKKVDVVNSVINKKMDVITHSSIRRMELTHSAIRWT